MAVNRDDYLTILEQSAQRVPYWARSTNPIVRRHLGLNWRTIPPELTPILKGIGIWAAIFGISLIIPAILGAVSILVIAAILVMPFIAGLYGHILLHVSITASDAMREEMQNETLALLRATPMTLNQILLGKVAVALWKRMDDLMLVTVFVLILTPPIFISGYAAYWPIQDTPLLGSAIVIIGLVVCVIRLIIEPVLVGVIAVFVSIIVPGRSIALTTSIAFSSFYFLMINLVARLPGIRGEILADGTTIPANLPLLFTVDFMLPLVLPVLLSYGLLRLAARIISRD